MCTVIKPNVQRSDDRSPATYMFAVGNYRGYRGITAFPITVSTSTSNIITTGIGKRQPKVVKNGATTLYRMNFSRGE